MTLSLAMAPQPDGHWHVLMAGQSGQIQRLDSTGKLVTPQPNLDDAESLATTVETDIIARALAVDASGFLTVAGETYSRNFPTSSGAYDTTQNGTGSRCQVGVDENHGNACIGRCGGTGVETEPSQPEYQNP